MSDKQEEKRILVNVLADGKDDEAFAAQQMAVLVGSARDNNLAGVVCNRKDNGDPVTVLCIVQDDEDGVGAVYVPVGVLFTDPESGFDGYLTPVSGEGVDKIENNVQH